MDSRRPDPPSGAAPPRRTLTEASAPYLEAISEAARDAIVLIDNAGLVTHWNPAAKRMFGRSAAEMLGNNLHETIAPERLRPAHREAFSRFRSTGEGAVVGQTLELPATHADGREFPVELSLSAVRIRGTWHALGILRDVTDRKQAEQALARAREETARQANAHAEELDRTNQRLRDAVEHTQHLAEAAEAGGKAKSAFVANMSHEIRTPMNAILGLTELLRGTELTHRQKDWLGKVHHAGKGLLAIINDILDFSKIDSGQMRIEGVPFDLGEVLEGVASLVGMRAAAKGLEFIYRVADDVPLALVGDPTRVAQILTNLTSNAIKFTERGEVVVDVRRMPDTQELQADQVTLRLAVRDTGIGIEPERIEQLFQPFEQADLSTTRRFGGTGLGLAITRRLLTLMGGRVGAQSELGVGSTFTVELPCGLQSEPRRGRSAPLAALQGQRALVVDDHPIAREILAEMLGSFGLQVSVAASGEEALQQLSMAGASLPELVLLDWRLPGMDGLEVAERLLSDLPNDGQQPVVLIVTAHGEAAVYSRANELGLAGVLTKPVGPSTLLDSVSAALFQRLGVAAVRSDSSPPALEEPRAHLELAGARVLLAEDNPLNQEVATALLRRWGVEVSVASDGEQAVRMAGEDRYDLILMDLQMPKLDGFEATRLIRTLPTGPDVPILAMTAHALVGDRERCLAAGMNDHVAKPIDQALLFGALQRWLRVRRHSVPPPELSGVAEPEAPPEPLPEHLEGIDLGVGLRRTGGDVAFYGKLLGEFGERYGGAAERVAKHLASGAGAAAAQTAHSLKGIAGTLGALQLQQAADDLEQALEQPDGGPLRPLRERFEQTLGVVLRSIASLDGPGRRSVTPAQIDAASAGQQGTLAKELRTCLQRGELVERELLEALGRSVGPTAPGSLWERLVEAVESFDYDEGLALLRELGAELNLELNFEPTGEEE